jgi:menaquinone-dependent protoporphyrinogen oxidase
VTKRILVTYASQTGFTEGVAEMIGETIADENLVVDVLPMKDVLDMAGYQAVVAGSGIQAGSWLPEGLDFIRKNQQELSRKPFAAFLVCMTLTMKGGDKYRSHVQEWMRPVKALVPTISENMFAGGLDIKKIPSFSDRMKFRFSTLIGVWKEGDHRDWEAIRDWAIELKGLIEKT